MEGETVRNRAGPFPWRGPLFTACAKYGTLGPKAIASKLAGVAESICSREFVPKFDDAGLEGPAQAEGCVVGVEVPWIGGAHE